MNNNNNTNTNTINNNSKSELPYYDGTYSQTTPLLQQQQQQNTYIYPPQYQYQQQQQHVVINPSSLVNNKVIKIGYEYSSWSFKGFSTEICDPTILNYLSPVEYCDAVTKLNNIVLKNYLVIYVPLILVSIAVLLLLTAMVNFLYVIGGVFGVFGVLLISGLFVFARKRSLITETIFNLNNTYRDRQIYFDVKYTKALVRNRGWGKMKPFCKFYIILPSSPVTTVESQYQQQPPQYPCK